MTAQAETHGFQTEARQLLKLMIHSLYSNREIFLRELISNASDAIDKLRFRSIAEPDLVAAGEEFAITIRFDKDARTVSVEDNGTGMTREESIEQLGTIAKSGTAEFLSQLTGDQQKDAHLIGQFGVGFYSAFIVADEVEVFTRAAGSGQGTRWVSRGEGRVLGGGCRYRPRHPGRAAPARGCAGLRRFVPPAQPGAQVLRPHRRARAHDQGCAGRRRRRRRRRSRNRGATGTGNRQRGQGAVEPFPLRGQRRRVQVVLQAHLPRFRGSPGLEPQPGGGQA